MHELIARLVRAREEKNITLQEISYKTNIRLENLARLESGDITFQPMPYIRAMIRKYAETIGVKIDPSEFETHTDISTSESSKKEALTNSQGTSSRRVNVQLPKLEQINPRLVYASVVGVLIVILCVIWLAFRKTETVPQEEVRPVSEQKPVTKLHETPVVQEQKLEPKIEPKKTDENALVVTEVQQKPTQEHIEPVNQHKPDKKHTLVVRTKADSCWISVASDENNAKEMLLMPSATAEFNADSVFTLTVGRLETAEFWLNGKPVTLPRRSGTLSSFKLMPPKD